MAVDFNKTGEVRLDQLIDELNQAASQLGYQFPNATVHWVQAEEVVRIMNATGGVDGTKDVEALATQYYTQIQNLITAHVPTARYFPQEIRDYEIDIARDKIRAAGLHTKTPIEIYTTMQSKIDSWTSLAQAKADLREWLPMLAVATIFFDHHE